MGWTFSHRDKGESNVEFFQHTFGNGYTILDGATVSSTFYAAVRQPDGLVSAAVILTKWVPRDEYNFGYKDMDESMGPGEYRCPARILDLLSPTDQLYGPVRYTEAEGWEGPAGSPTGARAWADKWRAECRAELAKRGQVRKGTRIRIPYINSVYKVWEITDLRRNRFFPVSEAGETITWGPAHRIPWWRNSNYEVVT